MRIDPNQFPGNVQQDNVQQANTRGAQPSQTSGTPDDAQVDPQDSFQLSGTLGQVQQLKAQLAQLPDVRSERVAALRHQVEQGSYKPTNEQIANAMISELSGGSRS
jgi:negative regulator of flagellin synthesis FlgM